MSAEREYEILRYLEERNAQGKKIEIDASMACEIIDLIKRGQTARCCYECDEYIPITTDLVTNGIEVYCLQCAMKHNLQDNEDFIVE